MQRNILLIDNRVENYEAIVASVQTDTTKFVVFDVAEMALAEAETSDFSIIMSMIEAEIGNGNKSIDNIGLVQHNYDRAYYQMFGNRCKRAPVIGVEEIDPTLTVGWDEIGSFLNSLKTIYGVQHFDMMACSIYSSPGWKYIIDNLSEQTGIGIRASTDITGSSFRGGNWFLESHTGVDLKTVYFTEKIETYNGTLFTNNSNNKYTVGLNTTIMDSAYVASWSTLSIPTIPSAPSRPTIPSSPPPSLSGDGININGMWGFPNGLSPVPSGGALTNIIQVVSTSSGFATLNKYGAVSVYGNSLDLTPSGSSVSSGVVRIYNNEGAYAALKSDGSVVSINKNINNRYPVNFTITSGIVKVLGGRSESFAIDGSGALVAWDTSNPFLSFSTVYPSSASLSSGVVEVYSNWGNANLALKSDGSIVTFGYAGFGGSAGDNHVGVTFNAITAGRTSWAGIDTSGGIVLINNANPIYNPYSVSLTSGWVKIIEVNALYFCALRNDGAVVTWKDTYAASNQNDHLYATRYPSGINMGSGSGIVNIYDVGTVGFAALTSSGQLIRWGGYSNNLYSGTSGTSVTSGVVDVCAAAGSAVALKSDGSVFIWGRDVPTGGTAFTPQNPSLGSGSGIVRIFSSNYSQLVFLKSDKTMIYWSRFATGRTIANNYLGGSSISSVDTVFYSEDGFMSVGGPAPIAPTITWVSIPGKTYGDAPFNLTDPSSNSSTAFSYSSGTPSVATISGSTVTILSGGSSVITATQPVNGTTYWDGSITATLTVALGTSNLSASTFSVATTKEYGDAAFSAIALPTSNSSGAITYSSSNTAVATINASGTLITIVGMGTVTFTATQAATSQYASATKTSNTLTVTLATPTLSASTFSVATTKTYGDAAFSAIALPTSNSSGTITYSSSNTAVATIDASGTLITLVGAGDATFTATQAATSQYASATKTSNTLTVYGTTPTLSASTFSVATTKTYGDAAFGATTLPTSNSSGAITYSSSNTAVATIDASGTLITLVGAGDATFTATQAATSQYASATKTSNTLTVYVGTPTLSASAFSVATTKTYGDAAFSAIALPTSNSSGAITYSSSNTAVATINASGTLITLVGAGDATFTATQAATSQYASATKTSNTLTVYVGTPTLSASTFSVATTKMYGDASFNVTTFPTSNSSGAITYSSSNTGVATIDASETTPKVIIYSGINYTGSSLELDLGDYADSWLAPRGFNDNIGSIIIPQGISVRVWQNSFFGAGDAVYTSNISVTTVSSISSLRITGTSSTVCRINILSAGTVTFTATQAATSQYASATKTSNTLTVDLATPTLAFVSPPTTKNITDASFVLSSTSASPVAVTYTSSNTAYATVGSATGQVTLVGAGTVTITANQASSANYNAPTSASCSIVISPAGSALAGQSVASGTSFANLNLAGASLVGATLSGVSFSGATLTGANFSGAVITGANFTNANLSGATNLPTFSTVQKLQLLRNINNVAIGAVQISTTVSGADISALISTPIPEIDSTTAFTIKAPTAVDASSNKLIAVSTEDVSNNTSIYIPMNTGENIKINGTVFSFNGVNLLDASGNVRSYLTIAGAPFRIYAGSIIGLNLSSVMNQVSFTAAHTGLYTILAELFVLK